MLSLRLSCWLLGRRRSRRWLLLLLLLWLLLAHCRHGGGRPRRHGCRSGGGDQLRLEEGNHRASDGAMPIVVLTAWVSHLPTGA